MAHYCYTFDSGIGMSENFVFQIHWIKKMATIIKVEPHPLVVAIANPILKPLPLIPINCSALILLAINDAWPTKSSDPSAKNNLYYSFLLSFFLL
jgi:malic enzyme